MPTASILRLFLPVTAALSLTAAAAAQTPQDASARKLARGPSIGVVDFLKAVDQYPRYVELREKLIAVKKRYDLQIEEMSARIEELRGTIQVLAQGSQEREDKQFEYQMAMQSRDYRRKAFGQQIQLQNLRNTLACYEDVDYVIDRVARRKGVALVLPKQDIPPSKEPIEELRGVEVEARVSAYERRQVLFASRELDITADVIKELMVPVPDRNSPERAAKDPSAPKAADPAGGKE